ncbi:MAG: hypothetical protein MUO24_02355 [Desulfobacterales bacterium]|nr:hypothetical protein [Desulfobacterales bacterium]
MMKEKIRRPKGRPRKYYTEEARKEALAGQQHNYYLARKKKLKRLEKFEKMLIATD